VKEREMERERERQKDHMCLGIKSHIDLF
jgi:hypothetical protein